MARSTPAPRRRRAVLQIVVGVVVVVVAAAIVFGFRLGASPHSTGSNSAAPSAKQPAAAASVVDKVASVPASVFNAVGTGSAQVAPTKISAPALAEGGKPLVVYVGGEFCPYCAAERWPLAVALSRFGTLTGLGEVISAPSPEVYPKTATLTFHGATFTSDYLALDAKEIFDEQHNPLDTLTSTENQLVTKYDAPPYVQQNGAIPFLDVGGTWVVAGAQFDPSVLKGLSQAQIAADLSNPNSSVGKSIIGTANVLTVTLCERTGGKPTSVCQSPGVKAAAVAMGAK